MDSKDKQWIINYYNGTPMRIQLGCNGTASVPYVPTGLMGIVVIISG